jgi:hypothetical protein
LLLHRLAHHVSRQHVIMVSQPETVAEVILTAAAVDRAVVAAR